MVMSPKTARRFVSPQDAPLCGCLLPVRMVHAGVSVLVSCPRNGIHARVCLPPTPLSWAAPRTSRHGLGRQPPLTTGAQTRPSLASPLCSHLHLSALSATPRAPLRTSPHRHAPPRHHPRRSAAIQRRNPACSSCEPYKYAKVRIVCPKVRIVCPPQPWNLFNRTQCGCRPAQT